MTPAKPRHTAYRYRQREAARQKARRRMALVAIGGVVVVVVIALVIASIGGGSGSSSALPTGAEASAIVQTVTSVPVNVSDAVGSGSVTAKPAKLSGAPLTSNGKPEVLYIGAEFCPFCATERWPMVVALSRFGTFSNLGFTQSSSTDTFPNTSTFTFHGSSYTSNFVSFTPVETQTRAGAPLETPNVSDASLWTQLDPNHTIPFLDLGGLSLVTGATYDASVLQHRTWKDIADALGDPTNPIARGVLGAANDITAAICKATNNQPASVCTSAAITTIEGQLGG